MRIPFFRAAAGLLVASGLAGQQAKASGFLEQPSSGPVVVTNDHGGDLRAYESQLSSYRSAGREIQIRGLCNSACTVALSSENVCVTPSARVGFHQAYNPDTREVVLDASARLFSYYPRSVQAKLGALTRGMRTLSGSTLISLGVRNCSARGPVARTQSAAPLARQALRHRL